MDEQEQTTEVRDTNVREGATDVSRQTVTKTSQADSRVVAVRIIWYFAGFIIILLLIRIVLLLLAANQGNGFVDFIYAISGLFAVPFYGIFSYTPSYGDSVFEVSSVVAIAVYALVAWGIGKLFTLTAAHDAV